MHSITQSDSLTVIELLSSLMLSCPSAPASLFPNLRQLTWHADGTHCAAEFLRMAFVPTLLSLDMQISSESSFFLSVLSSLGTLCPHLQVLIMTSATNGLLRKASPFVAQSISQLNCLKTLYVWDLGNQGNEHLMQLPALQVLVLDLQTSSAWKGRSRLQFPGFHNLNYLVLFIDNFNYALDFPRSLQVIDSKNIGIYFTAAHSFRSSYTALSQLFTILGEKCDHNNLISFSLFDSTGVSTNPDVFKPLHACHNLTQLLVERSWRISMADEELCQLVRGWPKLQVLDISRFVAVRATTIPTLHGLISLLQLCPALTSLTLVIDITKLDGIDFKSPGGGICNNHLEKLVLSNSPMKSPLNVALILSGLFPNLLKVDLDCWDPLVPKIPMSRVRSEKQLEQWKAVNLFLHSFHVVRERCTESMSSDS